MDTRFILANETFIADIYVDANDDKGVHHAAAALTGDIELVTGTAPQYKTTPDALSEHAVIAGVIGGNPVIDRLIEDGKLDVSAIRGKWESYILATVEDPAPGVKRALVVAGSDKRGAVYGVYKISEMIGVSPWVWWADSVPEKREELTFSNTLIVQSEPSVKYRGIFFNDEAPSWSTWVKRFGTCANPTATQGANSSFYTKVFELILRLKGNFMWPAMWNNAFCTDDPLNPMLATEYGIVVGTSHHEPMGRADKEWNWHGTGDWNYYQNKENIYNFWLDGMRQRHDLDMIFTLGMRGQADSRILPQGSTVADNVAFLNTIIADQREIIRDVTGAEDSVPQVWALYKEVEDYYYGEGMVVPDDVILLLCDDNFANVRTLPTEGMRKHPGGYGMYYHFDYVGGPRSYKWVNTTPLAKVREQMAMAYEYGIRQLWVVNVGDLKPMELPIDYFLNLAYDFNTWSAEGAQRAFTEQWAAREFGARYARRAADILDEYTRINGIRKPEVIFPETFSLTAYDEADTLLARYEAAVKSAESIYITMPEHKKDAFFQLVLYPARASMNVLKLNVMLAKNALYAAYNLPAANTFADAAQAVFDADKADAKYYNEELADGKWSGMMNQSHMHFRVWHDHPEDKMPEVKRVIPSAEGAAVMVQGSEKPLLIGETGALEPFSNLENETRWFELNNRGEVPFAYTITTDADWVWRDTGGGICAESVRVGVRVDWAKAPENGGTATVTTHTPDGEINVRVTALPQFDASTLAENTYVESHGYVAIDPSRFADNVPSADGAAWTVLRDYGKTGDSVKRLPDSGKVYDFTNAPIIDYRFFLQHGGEYEVRVVIAPTNNLVHSSIIPNSEQLRVAVGLDGGEVRMQSGIPENFAVINPVWEQGVLDNARTVKFPAVALDDGEHTLRLYGVDPGVAMQRIVITRADGAKECFTGPPESFAVRNTQG